MFFSCLNKFYLFTGLLSRRLCRRSSSTFHSSYFCRLIQAIPSPYLDSLYVFNMSLLFYGTRINYGDIYIFNMFSFFFIIIIIAGLRIFNSLIGSLSTIVCLCLDGIFMRSSARFFLTFIREKKCISDESLRATDRNYHDADRFPQIRRMIAPVSDSLCRAIKTNKFVSNFLPVWPSF